MAFKMTSPFHAEEPKSDASKISQGLTTMQARAPQIRKAYEEAQLKKKNTKKPPPKKDIKKTPPKETTTAKRTTYNNKNLGGQDQLIKKDKKKQEFVPSPKKATPPPKDKVKVTPKDKIKAGRALKKEGRKEKRSERKDARLERRIARATKKGKAALASGKVGKGSKSLEMRRKVDRLKAKKTSKGETAKTKPKTKIDFSALGTSLKGEAKKEDKPKKEDTNKSNKGGSAMMMKKGGSPAKAVGDPKDPKKKYGKVTVKKEKKGNTTTVTATRPYSTTKGKKTYKQFEKEGGNVAAAKKFNKGSDTKSITVVDKKQIGAKKLSTTPKSKISSAKPSIKKYTPREKNKITQTLRKREALDTREEKQTAFDKAHGSTASQRSKSHNPQKKKKNLFKVKSNLRKRVSRKSNFKQSCN